MTYAGMSSSERHAAAHCLRRTRQTLTYCREREAYERAMGTWTPSISKVLADMRQETRHKLSGMRDLLDALYN